MKKLQERYKDDKERLQPGDDEVLPGEQGQPVRPRASRWWRSSRSSSRCTTCCAPTSGTTSARRSTRHRASSSPCPAAPTADSSFLFIPDLTDKATGAVLIVADRPLRRLAAVLDAADVDDDGQDAADDLHGAAVRLRHLHDPLPGRPARLLDHDEPLDDRAAGDHPQAPRPAATTGRRAGGRGLRQRAGGRRRRRQAPPAVRPTARRTATPARAPSAPAAGERGAEGRAGGPAAGTAAQEEEAVWETAMSANEHAPIGCAICSSTSARRSALDGDVDDRGARAASIRATLEGDDLGLFIGRHGQTIDAVQHLAFKAANRDRRARRRPARRRRRRRLPRAPRAGAAAPGRRGRGEGRRARPAGGAGRHERDRAQGRARVPQGPRRTSRRTPRAPSPIGTSSWRRSTERFT